MNELHYLTKPLIRLQKIERKKLQELSKVQLTLRWMKRCISLLEALGPGWCIVDPVWNANYESNNDASLYVDIYEAICFRNNNIKDYWVYFDWSTISIQKTTQDEDSPYEEIYIFEPDENPPLGFLYKVYTIKEAAACINNLLAAFKSHLIERSNYEAF